jgi:hypothetical protein
MARRRAARVDENQPEVVAAFREEGCSVAITSTVGDGFPDIVVGLDDVNVLVEIKDGRKPPSARRLTDDQVDFHSGWRGWIEVVKNTEEVRALVRRMRERAASHRDGGAPGSGADSLEARVSDAACP